MRGVCAPRRPLAAPFAVPCRLQRTTPHTLHGMWGAVAGGRGRGVGRWRLWAARASVWWAGGRCGSPPSPRSHAVPRAPPPQVQLHLVEMIKAKKSGAGHRMYKVCRRVLTGPISLAVYGSERRTLSYSTLYTLST